MTTSSREEVLARIRTALGRTGDGAPAPAAVPRDHRTADGRPPGDPALLDLLADRLTDYRATVHRCPPGAVGATVAAALAALPGTPTDGVRLAVPPGLPDDWLPDDRLPGDPLPGDRLPGDRLPGLVTLVDAPDAPLAVGVLDGVDAVLTGCTVAVAATGTLVLDGSPVCGRRALTLVPDRHLVVVGAGQVVGSVPEALGRLDPHRPLTWVSGPSATSDIELDRVEGVHGPRTLVVVLVGG